MTAVPTLLERIRKVCRPGLWSQGVNLARAQAVAIESQSESEIVLRVKAPGRAVAPTVVLYPGEGEWECDCPSRVNPCEHVAAAAIALGQGETTPEAAPPTTRVWGRLVYRFSRAEEGLRVARAIVTGDGTECPLEGTLASVLARGADQAPLQPEQHDLLADRLLERGGRAVLAADKLDALLRVLVGARDVTLDGRQVAVSDEEVLPQAIVEDQGDEVVLTIRRDPRITGVVSPGIALCGDALCRLGELSLAGGWLQHLPSVLRFPQSQVGELSTRVLPDLARRMAVDVRSRRLPRIDRGLRPRVLLELSQVAGSLSVLPKLVYGAPPAVRIDDGRMVYLRGGVPMRDEPAERRLVQQLRDELSLVPGRRATFTGADAAQLVDRLRRWRGDLGGDVAGIVGNQVRLVPHLRVTGDATDVRLELDFGKSDGGHVDAGAVVRAWQEGLGLVPLEGGGWATLPQAWLDRHGQQVADLLAARQADGRIAAHALPALGVLCAELDHPPPPGLDRLAPLFAGFERVPEAPLPSDLTAELRPYQRQGVSWLAFLRGAGLGGVLADDMGLGKTVQALCALATPALVVSPTSVLPNWEAELVRFRPGLRVASYHGPGRQLTGDADVVLTSYAILRLDAARLSEKKWATVILDEAQAIKNPDSQVARAAYALPAPFRVALTGTPLENRLEELWSLLHFTNPGLLGGRRDFDDRFGRPIADGDSQALDRLRQRIRPFVLRRLKRDVAPELPPRTEMVLSVALDERERSIYDAVFAATRAEVVALLESGGSVMKALEALLRLRQAACHPALVPGQQARSSSKLERLVEVLETAVADGHKALVFSQWTSLLDLVEPALRDVGITFCRLDGSTKNRGDVVAGFQDAAGPPVMLLSLKAGGTGLNLTAADHVFLLDPWWNPAVEAQAADRAHRIGQQRPVFINRLVALGTVEEKILKMQEKKRALFEAALDGGGAAAGLTREDLLALMQ